MAVAVDVPPEQKRPRPGTTTTFTHMTAVTKLFRFEPLSGAVMVAAMVVALLIANSPLEALYNLVHHAPVHLRLGPLVIEKPLVLWINEGLMVLFFLVVGLEIKREFLEGHLSTPSQAALPFLAALGGMAIPAAIFVSINWNNETLLRGWAIPTATDIALALGILSFLGQRVPAAVKVFLTALAIFDDLGAVLIVGLFYGEGLSIIPLLLAVTAFIGLLLLNRKGETRVFPFVAIGLLLWVFLLKSGIAAALAGVLIGISVPMRSAVGRGSPLRQTERRLHPWVVLAVVPLFAFFNAGVSLEGASVATLVTPVSLGVALGLFLGKQIGVMGAVWLAVHTGLARLPDRTSWPQLYGAALLAGIGFTMSLFVASLAFSDPHAAIAAKVGILSASAVSAMAGLAVLRISTPRSAVPRSIQQECSQETTLCRHTHVLNGTGSHQQKSP